MQGRYTVDGMAPDHGQVGHTHLLLLAFLDERHTVQSRQVAWPYSGDMLQELMVDVIDNLHAPREDVFEEGDWPLLHRLRQQRVVGVTHGRLGYLPGSLPG